MVRKTMKIHSALDAGGGRVVRVVTVPSRDRFQAQAIWGIPVYFAFGLNAINLRGTMPRPNLAGCLFQ